LKDKKVPPEKKLPSDMKNAISGLSSEKTF